MNLVERNTTIMVVDDSPEDFETIKRAFRAAGLMNPIRHCDGGDMALDYLHGRGEFADQNAAPLPGIILLDLNMPGTDGREVLQEIKAHQSLRRIPVIVLTTSDDERDVSACYESGANSYVKKPVDINGFFVAVARLRDFWFEIAVLPKEEAV